MANYPRPVIMLSSLTQEGTVETIQALTLGAVDFIAKPAQKANINKVMEDVTAKIIRAARARVWSSPASLGSVSVGPKTIKPVRPYTKQDKVVFIGSSTGGPRALNTLVPALSSQIQAQAAVVIVQHMPVGFTHSLADRLDSLSLIRVKEAEPGDRLQVGMALLAPGGFHMTFDENNQVVLNQNPPVHGVRPAVDVTLTSLVQNLGNAIISVILTGMGNDGTNASLLVHDIGGTVIAEDESTCVVWGMPRSVIEAGAATIIAPLPEIAGSIEQSLTKSLNNRSGR
jgi:two-component system chemotaxis response regulator CheB